MIRRIITAVIAFILGATCAVGGFFVYRKVKPESKAFATQTAQTLHADANKNPYEDPNDPNTTEYGTIMSIERDKATIDGYFMDLNFQGRTLTVDTKGIQKIGKNFKSCVKSFTALVTFSDLKYKKLPVCITVPITVKIPAIMSKPFGGKYSLTIQENCTVRLPAAYYNFLVFEEEKNHVTCNNMQFTLNWNGTEAVGTKNTVYSAYKLYSKGIPVGSDDPTSPDFDLGSFGSLMAQIRENNGCDAVDFFKKYWKWIVGVIAVIFAFGLIVRVVKWVKG